MKLKVNVKSLGEAALHEFAPEVIRGYITEYFEGMTVKQFYDGAKEGLWSVIGKREKWLIAHKPWDLKWLTVKWIIAAIGRSNKPIACLILSSPELHNKLEAEIQGIKEKLS